MNFFNDPKRTHILSSILLLSGLALLAMGILGGYVFDDLLGLAEQTLAHILVILGPTMLKVGYVMRLNARKRLHLAA